MDSEATAPDISQFSDYRDFISACFEFEKNKNANFSFQYCANKIGTSKGYLKLITTKKRHISLEKISTIGGLFRLNVFEMRYLVVLFLKNTVADDMLKDYFDSALMQLTSRASSRFVDNIERTSGEGDTVFSSSLHMIIHSLVNAGGFVDDPKWVKDRLLGHDLSVSEIEQAICELKEDHLIFQENGVWRTNEFIFRTGSEFDKDNFQIYRIGLDKTWEILNDVKEHAPAHFHMMSISVTKDEAAEIFNMYTELRNKIMKISKESQGDKKVYFLSNNIFTVSK